MKIKNNKKRLLIKLGGQCNLNCPHCHCEESSFLFNKDIIPWIKEWNPFMITFGGGEPTMYFDLIKEITSLLGQKYIYRFVTNGTLITDEMVEFFNQYNFRIQISYDGEKSIRDCSLPIKWDTLNKLKNGYSVCSCFTGNQTLEEITLDLWKLKHSVASGLIIQAWQPAAFLHTLTLNSSNDVSEDIVRNYLDSYQKSFIECLQYYIQGYSLQNFYLLRHAINTWYLKKDISKGIICCSPVRKSLAIDGTFLLCPYTPKAIGSIYTGINWDKVESALPKRCKECDLKNICGNTCISNKTLNECLIAKEMYYFIKNVLNHFNIEEKLLKDYQELLNNSTLVE